MISIYEAFLGNCVTLGLEIGSCILESLELENSDNCVDQYAGVMNTELGAIDFRLTYLRTDNSVKVEIGASLTKDGTGIKPKMTIDFEGEGGNIFHIIGRVYTIIKSEYDKETADDFKKRAVKCGSYDKVLDLVREFIDINDRD